MSDFNEKLKELNDTADTTEQFDQNDIQKNIGMAVLAYISWLVLIPIFCAKDSKFARFHINQGLILAIVEIVGCAAFGILKHLPLIGWIFSLAGALLSLVCVVFSIIGIVNAVNGRAKELPVVGRFKILK